MDSLTYQQFIDEINNGKIIKALFKVKDYAHYKCCTIEREVVVRNNGDISIWIHVHLGNSYDNQFGRVYENFLFFRKFEEDCKMFKMGRKGTFNLKQMWDRIEFISIDYAP